MYTRGPARPYAPGDPPGHIHFAAVVVSIVGFGLKIKVIVNLIRMRRTQFHIGDSVEHDPYVPSVHAVAGNAAYAGMRTPKVHGQTREAPPRRQKEHFDLCRQHTRGVPVCYFFATSVPAMPTVSATFFNPPVTALFI